jgi:hypothetical protein
MSARPIYVGVGECRCGKLDARLYYVPGTIPMPEAVCADCLLVRGFTAPEPRTAEDILSVDDKLLWKQHEPLIHVGKLDLGYGHSFEVVLDIHDQLIGWLHTHPDARNPTTLCQSFCAVRPLNGTPVHQVVSPDPLTLTPSLQCRTCGAHGHVNNGKWEPCL